MGCLCKREFIGKPSLHAEDFTPSLLGKALLDILFILKKIEVIVSSLLLYMISLKHLSKGKREAS